MGHPRAATFRDLWQPTMSVRIAFGKGRGVEACIRLLKDRSIVVPPEFPSGRLTAFHSPDHDLVVVQVRNIDLPWLLEQGHIDIAFGSSVWFEEHGSPMLVQLHSLDICPCRLSLIVPENNEPLSVRRICTRFPRTTWRKTNAFLPNAQIIQMAGCNEVGLVLELCDAIVDVVETGWTLRSLGLTEHKVLCNLNHGVWIHRDRKHRIPSLRGLLPWINWERTDHGTDRKSLVPSRLI